MGRGNDQEKPRENKIDCSQIMGEQYRAMESKGWQEKVRERLIWWKIEVERGIERTI